MPFAYNVSTIVDISFYSSSLSKQPLLDPCYEVVVVPYLRFATSLPQRILSNLECLDSSEQLEIPTQPLALYSLNSVFYILHSGRAFFCRILCGFGGYINFSVKHFYGIVLMPPNGVSEAKTKEEIFLNLQIRQTEEG